MNDLQQLNDSKGFLITSGGNVLLLKKSLLKFPPAGWIFEVVTVHVSAKMWLLNTSAPGFIVILTQRKHF